MSLLPLSSLAMAERRNGPPVGTRYRGRTANYDPTSGRNYRNAVTLTPEVATRVIAVAERAGMSVSGVIAEMVARTELDATTGLPPWLEPADTGATLPLEGRAAS